MIKLIRNIYKVANEEKGIFGFLRIMSVSAFVIFLWIIFLELLFNLPPAALTGIGILIICGIIGLFIDTIIRALKVKE